MNTDLEFWKPAEGVNKFSILPYEIELPYRIISQEEAERLKEQWDNPTCSFCDTGFKPKKLYIEDYIDMLNTRSYSKEDRERCEKMWNKLKEMTKNSKAKFICNGKENK